SKNTDWYDGPTLMYLLETIHIASDQNHIDCRFPVQYVIRPQSTEYHDYRGYAGRIAGGVFKKGDKVMALPSGFTSYIKAIGTVDGGLLRACSASSVTIQLEDDIAISCRDMSVRESNVRTISHDVDVMICWMSDKPLQLNGK